MPFPPLNLSQIGKMCPIIENIPQSIAKFKSYKQIINKVGNSDLQKSKNKTANANFLFPVRKTFFVPIFPDPIFLISPYPKIFENVF